jgi:hypothetical protein
VARLEKDKEYMLRESALIQQEGWSRPHKHVSSGELLWAAGPRTGSNGDGGTGSEEPVGEKVES